MLQVLNPKDPVGDIVGVVAVLGVSVVLLDHRVLDPLFNDGVTSLNVHHFRYLFNLRREVL
ncbi:MAG: hypothetical protein ACK559_11780, partial [bacterium]